MRELIIIFILIISAACLGMITTMFGEKMKRLSLVTILVVTFVIPGGLMTLFCLRMYLIYGFVI